MEDEFRITLELETEGAAKTLERTLEAGFGDEQEISRHEHTIRLYADDKETARRIAEDARAAATPTAALKVVLERWNPGSGEWQAPNLPVEEAEYEHEHDPDPDPADLDFESLRYEVIVQSPERLPEGIDRRLLREGASVFAQGEGQRRLWAGATTEAEALLLAGHLRLETPPGTAIEVRPLTWWRRWLARERLLGNYAEGGGGGYY